MFRHRWRKPEQPVQPAPVEEYLSLRDQLLNLDPRKTGMNATDPADRVWGCVMETGYPKGTATLVCLRDGTTSLYTSSGGGFIGGGSYQAVIDATGALLAALSAELDRLPVQEDHSLPSAGQTIIRALTYEGPRAYKAVEDDLGNGRDPLSPVFYAAHGVITQLRLIDKRR